MLAAHTYRSLWKLRDGEDAGRFGVVGGGVMKATIGRVDFRWIPLAGYKHGTYYDLWNPYSKEFYINWLGIGIKLSVR